MNRAVQKLHQRRCALKNNLYGGGLAVNPEASFMSENGVPYAENQHYSDCYSQPRPGALDVKANPELAQVAMAGGFSNAKRQGCGLMRGGYNVMSAAQLMQLAGPAKTGGTRRRGCGCNQRGGGCGCSLFKRSGQYGGYQCGKAETAWLGGKRKTRKQKGGNKGGFEMAVAQNIGGNGPIAEPARVAVPCDPRAGMQNPFTATVAMPDARAAYGYSLTPNTTTPSVQAGGSRMEVPNSEYAQTGAGYGGNAYPAACYHAPGSEMPVYPATSAGFHFTPSTEGGATLPDGVTAYNEVVAHAARLGGAYRKGRSTKRTKKAKKSKRSRKH